MTRFNPLISALNLPQIIPTLFLRLFGLIKEHTAHVPEYIWFSFMQSVLASATLALHSFSSYLLSFVCLDVKVYDHDPAYAWLMAWLTAQQKWGGNRSYELSTVRDGVDAGDAFKSTWEKFAGDDKADRETVFFLPRESCWYRFWYHGLVSFAVLQLRTERSFRVTKTLDLRVYTWRGKSLLEEIMAEAMRLHRGIQHSESRVYIHRPADAYAEKHWAVVQEKQKRSMDTIVLEHGCVESLIKDIQEFLDNEEWYRLRGIPYRRGYLLHGPPGTGKTSLAGALAGHFGMDIYSLPLTTDGLRDDSVVKLMNKVPRKSIVLIEDIDATTKRRQAAAGETPINSQHDPWAPQHNVTLAGLLNAIDGIDSSEARIMIATTNHRERLDHALRRPGRFDVQIPFKLATRGQMKSLFTAFYSQSSTALAPGLNLLKTTAGDGTGSLGESKFAGYQSPSVMASHSGPGSIQSVHVTSLDSPPLDHSFSADRLDAELQSALLRRETGYSSDDNDSGSLTPTTPENSIVGFLPLEQMGPSSDTLVLTVPAILSQPASSSSSSPSTPLATALNALATTFANALPEYTYSMAALQGYLLKFKTDPFSACLGDNLERFRLEQEEDSKNSDDETATVPVPAEPSDTTKTVQATNEISTLPPTSSAIPAQPQATAPETEHAATNLVHTAQVQLVDSASPGGLPPPCWSPPRCCHCTGTTRANRRSLSLPNPTSPMEGPKATLVLNDIQLRPLLSAVPAPELPQPGQNLEAWTASPPPALSPLVGLPQPLTHTDCLVEESTDPAAVRV